MISITSYNTAWNKNVLFYRDHLTVLDTTERSDWNCVLGKKSHPTMMEGELNRESRGNCHPVVPTLGFRLVCSDSLSSRAMETRFKLGKKRGQHW